MLRRTFIGSGFAALAMSVSERNAGVRLAEAARRQVGVTTGYDPAYARMAYPGGDVARSTGVCADVIVRAARDGLGLDLQRLVHEDMARNFAAYPRTWGMAHPDANIDHRRVLNLETFWRRAGAERWHAEGRVPGSDFPGELAVGDIVTWLLAGRLPHVGIVVSLGPARVVHNIGNGAEETPLAAFQAQQAKGRFRWPVA